MEVGECMPAFAHSDTPSAIVLISGSMRLVAAVMDMRPSAVHDLPWRERFADAFLLHDCSDFAGSGEHLWHVTASLLLKEPLAWTSKPHSDQTINVA